MSKLDLIIPVQGVELIRDRIATVLKDEIANQIVLGADTEIDAAVFVERIVSIDKSEMPLINILFSRTSYDNNTAINADGENTYHIDVYTKAKATVGKRADNTSMERLMRILGVCRSILESPHYLTLGFAPPFIMSTRVATIDISDPRDNQDGSNTNMGRLVFMVDAVEVTEEILPRVAEGYDTTVTIEETDQGYVYVLNN